MHMPPLSVVINLASTTLEDSLLPMNLVSEELTMLS